MKTLKETAVLIKDNEGNYRAAIEVTASLDFIEEMRERGIPDASITDRLRNELTDIIVGLDSTVQKMQAKPKPAPQPQPKPAAPKPKLKPKRPEPEPEPEEDEDYEEEEQPEKGSAEDIAQEFEGVFDE